jgi:hypothetical protein
MGGIKKSMELILEKIWKRVVKKKTVEKTWKQINSTVVGKK